MNLEIKKKLRIIIFVFLALIAGSLFLGIQYFQATQDKWTVVYRLNNNMKILNSLKYINSQLFIAKHTAKEEDIIKDIMDYVNRQSHTNLLPQKLFENISGLSVTAKSIKFDTNNVINLDKDIDDFIFKLNQNIKKQINDKLRYMQIRVADTVYIEATKEIEDLKFRVKKVETVINVMPEDGTSEDLKLILFNLLSKELSEKSFNFISRINFNNVENKDLVLYLNTIIKEQEDRLEFLKKNPDQINSVSALYNKLSLEKDYIINTPFLDIYSVERLNRKPSLSFVLTGFLIVSLILGSIFSYILINEKSLKKVISKKLSAL